MLMSSELRFRISSLSCSKACFAYRKIQVLRLICEALNLWEQFVLVTFNFCDVEEKVHQK